MNRARSAADLRDAFLAVTRRSDARRGQLLRLAATQPAAVDAAAEIAPRGVTRLWRAVRGERLTNDTARRLNRLARRMGQAAQRPDT